MFSSKATKKVQKFVVIHCREKYGGRFYSKTLAFANVKTPQQTLLLISFQGVCFSVRKRFLFFLKTNATHSIHSRTISFSTKTCTIVAEKKFHKNLNYQKLSIKNQCFKIDALGLVGNTTNGTSFYFWCPLKVIFFRVVWSHQVYPGLI